MDVSPIHNRFCGGRSTPAMRAIFSPCRGLLPLALLMLGIDADHSHASAPVDHLALVTNFFDACPYFHGSYSFLSLLIAIDNPAARQVIRRKLHRDFVSRQNADEVLAHLAGDMREDLVFIFHGDAEHGIGQRFDHRGHHLNGIFLRIAGVVFLFLVLKLLGHKLLRSLLPGYHEGPVTPFGRVRIHGPFAVIATVCSKCAEGLPSAVSATHSSRMRTSGRPAFTIGSTAVTIPSFSLSPRPHSPLFSTLVSSNILVQL